MLTNEEILKVIGKTFNREMNGSLVGDHPLNFFARDDFLTETADAAYDLYAEKWVKPPLFTPEDFDPEAAFPEVWRLAERLAAEWDIHLGRLRRDTIEYDKALRALAHVRHKARLRRKLTRALDRIGVELRALADKYDELHAARKAAFSKDPDETREAWRASRNWTDENITYKLMERWGYLSLLHELEHRWGDTR